MDKLFSFDNVKIKEEFPDEISFASQLIDDAIPSSTDARGAIQSSTITQSKVPKISVRTSALFEEPHLDKQNQRTIKRSQSSTQREEENLRGYYNDRQSNAYASSSNSYEDSNASKKPRYENQSQNRNNRQKSSSASSNENIRRDNHQNNIYHDRQRNSNPYSGNSYEDSNASKKSRYENQSQNRNNRQENSLASSNENIRRDNHQTRNFTPPVRTNDPRLNRVTVNESSSTIYPNPTQAVPLPLRSPNNQCNFDAILHRCTEARTIIRNLKHSEKIPMVLFKYPIERELKPQQQSSERAKKSPLILNPKNVKYMLQASEDSSTGCQIALLSRQFKNISFPLQSAIRLIGADIDRISLGVANAELKRQKKESLNESMGTVFLSDRFRIIGTQTDDVNFEDKVPPKTFATIGMSCNIVLPNADKCQQTDLHTDGFHFSIDSLLLLTPAQREGLQVFKKLMNMSDDGKIASIRERQQHRKVNALMYRQDEDLSQHMNPPPAPRMSASKSSKSYGPPI